MKIILSGLVALMLFWVGAGFAHAVTYGQYYDRVIKVNVGTDNYLYINVPGNFSPSHGCSTPWYVRSQFPLTNDITKAWLQLATASLLSHTKVYINTNGCTVNAMTGYPIMILLQLEE